MASYDSYQPITTLKSSDSISNDGSVSVASDHASLTDSFNGTPTFQPIPNDTQEATEEQTNVSNGVTLRPPIEQTKKSRLSLFKDKTLPSSNLVVTFDGSLTRVLHHLENALLKSASESKGFGPYESSIDSQLADIRLMVDCEKDCSLLDKQGKYHHGYLNDRIFKSVLNEFDMKIMVILFNHYLKANINITNEVGKNRFPKKLIDTRILKRKSDCCLLLGAMEKAYQDYGNAADAFKSQNDLIWHAGLFERISSIFYFLHFS